MATVEEIHRHIDAAADDDPRQALIAVRKLINEDIPMLERRAVCIARRELSSWVRISRLLMRSRQSVRERFGSPDRPACRLAEALVPAAVRSVTVGRACCRRGG